jgi:hypothetical protein
LVGLQAKLMYPVNADGTLGFAGHLLSPTVSEASKGGRTDYYTDKEQHDLKACQRGYGRSCIINDWCEPDATNVNTAAMCNKRNRLHNDE